MPPLSVTLRGSGAVVTLSEAGVYLASDEGIRRCDGSEAVRGAAGFLIVDTIGDFVSAPPVPGSSGCGILVNNRPPLGRLQQLQDGDVIGIRRGRAHAGGVAEPSEFIYTRQPPPIRFVLSQASSVRCEYSLSPLSGKAALRCEGCLKLFESRVWEAELQSVCPNCGWPARE
jgi:hypothetical protein